MAEKRARELGEGGDGGGGVVKEGERKRVSVDDILSRIFLTTTPGGSAIDWTNRRVATGVSQLNKLTRKPKSFSRLAQRPELIAKMVDLLEAACSNAMNTTKQVGCLEETCLVELWSCLANLAVSSPCRAVLSSKTQIVDIVESFLKQSSLGSGVFARVARLISNLGQEAATAEAMFANSVIFSLLKHATDTSHKRDPDSVQGVARALRLLCAGRAELLNALMAHGGVSLLCSFLSSPLSDAVFLEILKALKEFTTNCSLELAAQIKDSGILPTLVETASRTSCPVSNTPSLGGAGAASSDEEDIEDDTSTSSLAASSSTCSSSLSSLKAVQSCSGLALACISQLVQFTVTRSVLGCHGCIKLFFGVIANPTETYTTMEVDRAISGVCYLARECLTRMRMRDDGFLPQFVGLLNNPHHSKHHSNLITSLFCFIYDEPSLAVMANHNLVSYLCNILDTYTNNTASHVKCSDKCQLKDKQLQSMRPELISLDYGLPWELNRSVSAPGYCASPNAGYQAPGDISPPWSFNSVFSPNHNATSPTRPRQWLPFSQSPNLESASPPYQYFSPNRYPSSSPAQSLQIDPFDSGLFDFSDEEDSENVSAPSKVMTETEMSEDQIAGIQASTEASSESAFQETQDIDEDRSSENKTDPNLDAVKSDDNSEPPEKMAKIEGAGRASGASETPPVIHQVKNYKLTCIEQNIVHFLSRLSQVNETSVHLCSQKACTSLLGYYAKLNHSHGQIVRTLERLCQSKINLSVMIQYKVPLALHKFSCSHAPMNWPVAELIDTIWSLIEEQCETEYFKKELDTSLRRGPVKFQLATAVSIPFIITSRASRKRFLVDHLWTINLLVSSFGELEEQLSEWDQLDAIVALKRIVSLTSGHNELGDESAVTSEANASICLPHETSHDLSLVFEDDETFEASRKVLRESSDVFRSMLDEDSPFLENKETSISLKTVQREPFIFLYEVFCLGRGKESSSFQVLTCEDLLKALFYIDMYQFAFEEETLIGLLCCKLSTPDEVVKFLDCVSQASNAIPNMLISLVSNIVLRKLFSWRSVGMDNESMSIDDNQCVQSMRKLSFNCLGFSQNFIEVFKLNVRNFYFS